MSNYKNIKLESLHKIFFNAGIKHQFCKSLTNGWSSQHLIIGDKDNYLSFSGANPFSCNNDKEKTHSLNSISFNINKDSVKFDIKIWEKEN
jgi:hypothetical protein